MSQVQIAAVLTLVQTCGGGSSTPEPATSTGYTCSDYELMLNIEAEMAADCSTDADCDQVLSGTGPEACETDDFIVAADYDPTWFYDTWEEAENEGCTIEFETPDECNPGATPVCLPVGSYPASRCQWL